MNRSDADPASDAANTAVELSSADVRKLARLARIRLAEGAVEEEQVVARLGGELRDVLGHIDRLQSLDVEGVEPMTRPHGGVNRLDPDEPGPTLDQETLRAAAPASEGPFIAVPKVLADGS